MKYTSAQIIDRFLIHVVEVTFIDGNRKRGRIIINNAPGKYRFMKTRFAFLPIHEREGCITFNPSHVRKIEFYHEGERVKLED